MRPANNKTSVRERILKAACALLGDCGLRKLAQPQIAKKAGVPQGHMTYYFPTRSDLLLAVAERSLEQVADAVMNNVKFKKPIPQQASLSIVKPLIKDVKRTRMLIGLLVESDENPELRKKLIEQAEFARGLIGIGTGLDPGSPEVKLINAALIGLGIQNYMTGDDSGLDPALELIQKKLVGD